MKYYRVWLYYRVKTTVHVLTLFFQHVLSKNCVVRVFRSSSTVTWTAVTIVWHSVLTHSLHYLLIFQQISHEAVLCHIAVDFNRWSSQASDFLPVCVDSNWSFHKSSWSSQASDFLPVCVDSNWSFHKSKFLSFLKD